MALSGALASLFVSRPWPKAGAGLMSPAVLVANFGTAAASSQAWSLGQALLVNKVVPPGPGASLYPERHIRSDWPETECRSLSGPLTDSEGLGRSLVDMEAYGINQVVSRYLTTSHLVLGKVVLDHPGEEDTLDWKTLTARLGDRYSEAAEQFADFALLHLDFLSQDPRRLKSLRVEDWSLEEMAYAEGQVTLTVTQKRQLAKALRAAASGFEVESQFEEKSRELRDYLAQAEGGTKHANSIILQHLQKLLPTSL